MVRRERDILERAARTVSEQTAKADALVDEALAAGLDGPHPVTVHAKMLRLELLQVKSRSRARARRAHPRLLGLRPHGPLGRRPRNPPGHWAHREPVPHGAPVV